MSARIRGVLLDCKGEALFIIFKSMGLKDSNEIKVLAIF